jgi:cobalt-zinc-cadmium efflux system protein
MSPHNHDDHGHDHGHGVSRVRLILAIGITFLFMAVEVVGGILTGSLALVSDAGHMFTDAFALGVTLFAIIWASRPPTPKVSYGYHRTEILAAQFNGLLLLGLTIFILYEAILRLFSPIHIDAENMMWVAAAGLVANLANAALLYSGQKGNLNVRSAFLHVLTDTASSLGVMLGAGAIWLWGVTWVDPLLSILISMLIFRWSWGLLAQSTRVLMEAAPPDIDLPGMIAKIKEKYPSIKDLHHIHIWSINENQPIMTAHLVTKMESMKECTDEMQDIEDFLQKEFGIVHSVLQMESDTGEVKACSLEPHAKHAD